MVIDLAGALVYLHEAAALLILHQGFAEAFGVMGNGHEIEPAVEVEICPKPAVGVEPADVHGIAHGHEVPPLFIPVQGVAVEEQIIVAVVVIVADGHPGVALIRERMFLENDAPVTGQGTRPGYQPGFYAQLLA